MGALIVLLQELLEKHGQFLVIMPRFVLQPFLETADKSLGNAIGFRSMSSDEHVDEFFTTDQGLESLSPDVCVVILDVKLRGTDGLTLYRQLKEKRPDIPIIFYSAYPGDEKVARQCLEMNPYAFIEKGVEADIDRLYSSS